MTQLNNMKWTGQGDDCIGQSDDCTTGCLLYFAYFEKKNTN